MKKVLALVLCVGILAGCQETPAETTKPPVTEYAFPAGAQLDVYAGLSSAMDGTELNKFIEEATGLDILWQTAGESGITAMLTEKVTPYLIYATTRTGINEMGRYGAYVNLWDY